jgi:hypothetical protein
LLGGVAITETVDGMVTTTDDGTLFGNNVHEITAVFVPTNTTLSMLLTHVTGTNTGEYTDGGIATVVGTTTKDDVGIVATFELGMNEITFDGTVLGTADHGMATKLGLD